MIAKGDHLSRKCKKYLYIPLSNNIVRLHIVLAYMHYAHPLFVNITMVIHLQQTLHSLS